MFLNLWIVSVLAHLHNKLNTEKSIKIFYIPLIKRTLKLQLFRLRRFNNWQSRDLFSMCICEDSSL